MARMGGVEWALLLALSVLWGGSYFFAKVALAELGPLTLAFLRVSLAALALHAVVRISGARMPAEARVWSRFLVMGLVNNAVPFALIFWGTARIPSGLAAILNAATPLFTVLLAHVLTADEKATARKLAGVAVGFAGVAVLVGPGALLALGGGTDEGMGAGLGAGTLPALACLAAALSYAFAGIYGRRFRALPAATVACGQVTASSMLLLPVALAFERPLAMPLPGPITWAAVLGLALASTALGYMLYFRILRTAGATNLLLVTLLIPASAMLLGALVLGEAATARELAGLGVIGAGLAILDGRALALARRIVSRAP